MALFPDLDVLSSFREEFSKLSKAMVAGGEHLLHIHNLQHSIIQEIVNTNIYRSYEGLGKEKIIGNRSHPPAFHAAAIAGIKGSVRLARAAATREQA